MARPLKLTAQALAFALVAGLLALLVWQVAHQSKPTKVGKPAPTFVAQRLDGHGDVSLKSFRGHPVVVNFWASWCPPCRAEAPAIERIWNEYRSRGLIVLGVDWTDASSDARAFVRKKGLTFPIVRDPTGLIGSRYDLTGAPETFVLDRRGRLVDHVIGGITDTSNGNAESFASALKKVLASPHRVAG